MSGLGSALAEGDPSVIKSSLATTPLCVMAARSDGFEAVWGVNRLSRGWLEWKLEDGHSGLAKADAFGFTPQGKDVLRVRLGGLKTNAKGRVRSHTIAADDGEITISPWKPFHILDPEAKKSFRIEPGGVIRKREIAPDGHTHKLPEKVWKKGDPEAKIPLPG